MTRGPDPRMSGSLHVEGDARDGGIVGHVFPNVECLVLKANPSDLPGPLGRALGHQYPACPWRFGIVRVSTAGEGDLRNLAVRRGRPADPAGHGDRSALSVV